MSHFKQDFLDFFIELAPNNNKEWFDENRSRYHTSVKEPFEQFVTLLIEKCRTIDKAIPEDLTYSQCIFRINRDIRFSKDKTPYKMNRSAVIGPHGKKDHGVPSLYFELGPEHVRLYSGIYKAQPKQIEGVRSFIKKNTSELHKIIENDDFNTHFGEIHGEKYKTVPKEYRELAQTLPLLYHKNWYIYKTYTPETLLAPNLDELFLNDFKMIYPFQSYFRKAMGFK